MADYETPDVAVPGEPAVVSPLRLELIGDLCGSGTCPSVYRTNRGTFVVQGRALTAQETGIDVALGEGLVEVPAGLISPNAEPA